VLLHIYIAQTLMQPVEFSEFEEGHLKVCAL
jgi:hypothetical protein